MSHLIVFDGLCEQLHVDRLVQLVFVQHVDEEVQRSFMNAHLWIQRAHLLVDLHTALTQSSDKHRDKKILIPPAARESE